MDDLKEATCEVFNKHVPAQRDPSITLGEIQHCISAIAFKTNDERKGARRICYEIIKQGYFSPEEYNEWNGDDTYEELKAEFGREL